MKITVAQMMDERDLQVSPGARLLDYLQSEDIPVNAACGGKGTCHKCRVQLEEGFLAISAADRRAFTENQIAQGWRLSCQARPRTHLRVRLPSAIGNKKTRITTHIPVESAQFQNPKVKVICDLGSTGMVLAVIDSEGALLWEAHVVNPQIQFGADVMTRLHYAQVRGQERLQEVLLTGLQSLIDQLPPGISSREIIVSGNSAMMTFLFAWDFSQLAVEPYQPIKLDSDRLTLKSGWTLLSLPLLGGFVGGDTFAGILALEKSAAQAPWLLVDIGTNTEIVLKTKSGKYYFASAPAGPAFEGGNITYGMRAEPGAIEHARWTGTNWNLRVIGEDLPCGICGSGLVDLLSESADHGLIERDGFLPDGSLSVAGDVQLLADDIREFQLAKSATRTGIDVVIDRAGEQPQKIYLAGTFAEHLDLKSVHAIGLLPPQIPAQTIGNASLEGAGIYARFSLDEQKKWNDTIKSQRIQIELALQDDFQDLFVKNLELR